MTITAETLKEAFAVAIAIVSQAKELLETISASDLTPYVEMANVLSS